MNGKKTPRTRKSGCVRIVFHNQKGREGSNDVFLAAGGKAYLIKREHKVVLPWDVVRALKGARNKKGLGRCYSYTVLARTRQ